MNAPLCRFCGGPIRKYCTTVFVRPEPSKNDHPSTWSRYVYATGLRSKADCQKLTNKKVMSVSYSVHGADKGFIDRWTEWNGEAYVDSYFCNGTHAKEFAYACVEMGGKQYGMPAYFDALKRQQEAA